MQQGIKKLQWLEYLKVVFLEILNPLLCRVFANQVTIVKGQIIYMYMFHFGLLVLLEICMQSQQVTTIIACKFKLDYWQLIGRLLAANFSTPCLTLSTLTRLCHSTLSLVGRPSTMMYSCGSGSVDMMSSEENCALNPASSSLSSVFWSGNGRKNIVPFTAFRQL